MEIELTETEAATIITALVLYAHIPKLTMDEDQKRAERLYKELKILQLKGGIDHDEFLRADGGRSGVSARGPRLLED